MPLFFNLKVVKREALEPDGFVEVSPPLFSLPLEKAPSPEEEIERAAAEERERLLAEARREAEEIRKKAYAEGFRQGWEEGRKKAEAKLAEEEKRLAALKEEFWRLREEVLRESEPEIVALAVTVAEKLLKQELTLAPEKVRAMVRAACREASAQKKAVLFVSPEDLPVLERYKEELKREFRPEVELYFAVDPGIARGGCRVETDLGEVDATLESQLKEIWNLLKETGVEGPWPCG